VIYVNRRRASHAGSAAKKLHLSSIPLPQKKTQDLMRMLTIVSHFVGCNQG
jgi:hypothetical protein